MALQRDEPGGGGEGLALGADDGGGLDVLPAPAPAPPVRMVGLQEHLRSGRGDGEVHDRLSAGLLDTEQVAVVDAGGERIGGVSDELRGGLGRHAEVGSERPVPGVDGLGSDAEQRDRGAARTRLSAAHEGADLLGVHRWL